MTDQRPKAGYVQQELGRPRQDLLDLKADPNASSNEDNDRLDDGRYDEGNA
jgi:hypothetical protein